MQNTGKHKCSCSSTNGFINFWLQLIDTRRETQFLQCYPTTHGTSRGVLDLNSSLLVGIRKTQVFDSMAESPTTRLHALMAENSTICLHGPISTSNWLFFKILKFARPSIPGMTSSTLLPHILSGIYYDNGDFHILCMQV